MKNNEEKNLPSVSINWYPGHMYKTKKQIIQDINLVDIVIEILDARIPIASSNPDIETIAKNKKKIILLNKKDLADDNKTCKWVQYFEKLGIKAIPINSNTSDGIKKSIDEITNIVSKELESNAKKGRVGKKIKAMIVGIPNVGKSSYINRLANKNIAGTQNKPGFTKQKQWYRLNEKIDLLDTPGILWPKFDDEVGMHLAMTGSIKETIIDLVEVAYNIIVFMLENYKENLISRFKLDEKEIDEILGNKDQEFNENILDIMNLIGKKRGAIISGGNVDLEKISKIIVDEFKGGKLGKITIEMPK